MHTGGMAPQNMPTVRHATWTPSGDGPKVKSEGRGEAGRFGDEVDDLISSVTGQGSYKREENVENLEQEADLADRAANAELVEVPIGTLERMEAEGNTSPPSKDGATAAALRRADDADPTTTTSAKHAAESDPLTIATTDAAPLKKKSKKEKKPTVPTKMVYSDEVVSPEEKLAVRPKYAFDRNASEKTEFVQGDISGAVTGETASETVRDPQD